MFLELQVWPSLWYVRSVKCQVSPVTPWNAGVSHRPGHKHFNIHKRTSEFCMLSARMNSLANLTNNLSRFIGIICAIFLMTFMRIPTQASGPVYKSTNLSPSFEDGESFESSKTLIVDVRRI